MIYQTVFLLFIGGVVASTLVPYEMHENITAEHASVVEIAMRYVHAFTCIDFIDVGNMTANDTEQLPINWPLLTVRSVSWETLLDASEQNESPFIDDCLYVPPVDVDATGELLLTDKCNTAADVLLSLLHHLGVVPAALRADRDNYVILSEPRLAVNISVDGNDTALNETIAFNETAINSTKVLLSNETTINSTEIERQTAIARAFRYNISYVGRAFDYGSIALSRQLRTKDLIFDILTTKERYNYTIAQQEVISFNDIALLHVLHRCRQPCPTFARQCYNGGVPHPNLCGECICPTTMAPPECRQQQADMVMPVKKNFRTAVFTSKMLIKRLRTQNRSLNKPIKQFTIVFVAENHEMPVCQLTILFKTSCITDSSQTGRVQFHCQQHQRLHCQHDGIAI